MRSQSPMTGTRSVQGVVGHDPVLEQLVAHRDGERDAEAKAMRAASPSSRRVRRVRFAGVQVLSLQDVPVSLRADGARASSRPGSSRRRDRSDWA